MSITGLGKSLRVVAPSLDDPESLTTADESPPASSVDWNWLLSASLEQALAPTTAASAIGRTRKGVASFTRVFRAYRARLDFVRMPAPMRRLPLVSISGALLASAGFVAASFASASCSTHACDGSHVELTDIDGGLPSAHLYATQNTWESNAIDGPWFDLGPQKSIKFDVSGWQSRKILSTEAYLSVDSNPVANGSNWALGSGNVAEIEQVLGNEMLFVQVHNDTCGQYFLRLVVRGSDPPPPSVVDASAADAAPGSDAGASDGATDGGTDGAPGAEAGIVDAADAG